VSIARSVASQAPYLSSIRSLSHATTSFSMSEITRSITSASTSALEAEVVTELCCASTSFGKGQIARNRTGQHLLVLFGRIVGGPAVEVGCQSMVAVVMLVLS